MKECQVALNTGITGAFYTGDIVTGSVQINYKSKDTLQCKIIYNIIVIFIHNWIVINLI